MIVMKKVLTIILAMALVISFAGCGADNASETKESEAKTEYGIDNSKAAETDSIKVDIENKTGFELASIKLSPDGAEFSDNLLKENLADGASASLSYSSSAKSKEWIIEVTTVDGKTAKWSHVALGELEKFALGAINQ